MAGEEDLPEIYQKTKSFYRVFVKMVSGKRQVWSNLPWRWDPLLDEESSSWAVPTFEEWLDIRRDILDRLDRS